MQTSKQSNTVQTKHSQPPVTGSFLASSSEARGIEFCSAEWWCIWLKDIQYGFITQFYVSPVNVFDFLCILLICRHAAIDATYKL